MNERKNFLELVKQCMLVCLVVFVISLGAVNAFGQDGAQDNVLYLDIDSASLDTQNIPAAAPPSGTLPVYRFFNTETGTHFYTISEEEKNHIIATWPQFQFEGPVFYAYPAPAPDVTPPPSTTPHAGRWDGSTLSFYVSSNGSSITSTGSSLYVAGIGYVALKLNVGSSCIVTITGTIPINNNAFTVSGSTLNISGQFNSSTSSASGTYSSTNYGCVGSGTWTTYY